MHSPRSTLFLLLCLLAACSNDPRVGPTEDGAWVVNTLQRIEPAGSTLLLPTRPVALSLSPTGAYLVAKDNKGLALFRTAPFEELQRLAFPSNGGSPHGLIFIDAHRVIASDSGSSLHVASLEADKLTWTQRIACPKPAIGGNAFPCGMALAADGTTLYVALSRNNSLGVVDLLTGKCSAEIPVGAAPYDVVLSTDGERAWVSDWAGGPPLAGQAAALSSGTLVAVDARGVACSGFVSVVDLAAQRELQRIPVGLHPGDLLADGSGLLFCANANSDSVSVIDTQTLRVVNTIAVQPIADLPFGCTPLALAFDTTKRHLSVALANTNAIATFAISADGKSATRVGLVPAGWYPGALVRAKDNLYVANVKGIGPRVPRLDKKGEAAGVESFNTHRHQGSITAMPLALVDEEQSALQHRAVADARLQEAFRGAHPQAQRPATRVVPRGPGESSPLRHVVYIIKENRTYDQVFGDLPQGDGEPRLCIFPRAITPNHHALAEEFVLLDNYYCNGVLSADGHSWATEAWASDHFEKSFGGFTRSYTSGDDAAAYSPKGHIWNLVLEHGLTFRNFGEMVHTELNPANLDWASVRAAQRNTTIPMTHQIFLEPLQAVSEPGAAGWNLGVPDQARADVFIAALKRCEASGQFPNLSILYLPQDHTSGTAPGKPTPRAHVGDNDLALGRVVEALSQSRFWNEMVIFVNEDDPQNGFDHIDGHRSLCLVVSPYTKRGSVSSRFANQTSVLHTIEAILGLPPLTQMDAAAPLMDFCFTTTADTRPYRCRPAGVDIDELTPQPKTAKEKAFAALTEAQDLARVDAADEDSLNRILWFAMRGDEPYPADWAGPHGRGLASKHLRLESATKSR
ncbi:MAG: phosphoesterase [Planctomycetes bacterium]|nr:phosphoesterase [Planctomycetota bacterium]